MGESDSECEIWKPIVDYEGLYEISNRGNVRSLCAGRWKSRIMRKPVKDKDGYLTVNLKKNGRYKCAKIHRLVAEAFLDNPNNFPCINHKDENKTNNHVINLEWCTIKYNNNYKGKPAKYFKAVIQMDTGGNEIARFNSVNEAAASIGKNPACISGVLSGRRNQTGGYKWAYQC